MLREASYSDSILGKCDKCEGSLRKIKSRNNKWFLGCTNYPKCTNTYPLPQKGKIIPLQKDCEFCKKPTIQVIGKRYKFQMCIEPNCESKKDWKKKSDFKQKQEKDLKEENGKDSKEGKEKSTKEKAVAKKEQVKTQAV
ncbi:MAG: topoisomerase DNA-binding C4 zinc finger domain-containing protein [Candidatus Diapherotrites archaeon]